MTHPTPGYNPHPRITSVCMYVTNIYFLLIYFLNNLLIFFIYEYHICATYTFLKHF